MRKGNKRVKHIVLFLTGIFTIFLTLNFTYTKVYAEDSLCPSTMDPNSWECYNYLSKKSSELKKQQSSLEDKLADEEYAQLNLTQKINYITNQISQSEKLIESMEVEISAKTVEIGLLEKELLEKEDSISIMKQEISILEESVNQRIEESYKYSFIGTLEIFLNGGDLDSILRKTKYLIETREKDKEALSEMNDKVGELKAEELELASEKEVLESKKVELEEQKTGLVTEKKELDEQKEEKNILLAESKAKQKEYQEDLAYVSEVISSVDQIKTDLLYELYKSGQLGDGAPVQKSQPIGKEGHTGCSFGSHLHYEVRTSAGIRINPDDGYLNVGGLYSSITSGSYYSPLAGAILTGTYTSSHKALDMVSTVEGNQNYEKYTVPYGLCSDVDNILNYRRYTLKLADWNKAYLTGEGANVYASESGTIYFKTYSDGGRAAIIEHEDGSTTFYLHLQNQ